MCDENKLNKKKEEENKINIRTFYLVINGEVIACRSCRYDDEKYNPIDDLLDILYEKYPIIDLYNNNICWFDSTRKDACEYLDVHEGRYFFACGDPIDNKTGEYLDILIFEEGYSWDLDEDDLNDKALIDYIKNKNENEN